MEKADSKRRKMLKDSIFEFCAFVEQFFLIKSSYNSPDTIQQLLVVTS